MIEYSMTRFIADLHIHSPWSSATSKAVTPQNMELWAKRKGIQVLATGDCLHPKWRATLQQDLISADNGLFTLGNNASLQFVLSTEISTIYKKNNKVRKFITFACSPHGSS